MLASGARHLPYGGSSCCSMHGRHLRSASRKFLARRDGGDRPGLQACMRRQAAQHWQALDSEHWQCLARDLQVSKLVDL